MIAGDAPLPLAELAEALKLGRLRCRDVIEDTIGAIEAREPDVRAWVRLASRERLVAMADALDALPMDRRGALHGLPVGIKDTIDTCDFPTELGGAAWRDRQPGKDAVCVALARHAGAIIPGKTVTTEYALREPSVTRNPHDSTRSPGGSSAGSAAAVAAGMIPLALGSQTNGSMLRPASYCGVFGFKPSFGVLPLAGVAPIGPTIDTLGIFSRDASGLALAAEVLARPAVSAPSRLPGLSAAVENRRPKPFRIGICRAGWSSVEAGVQSAVEDFVSALARKHPVRDLIWPLALEGVFEQHMVIQDAGVATQLGTLKSERFALLSRGLQQNIERGLQLTAVQLTTALEMQEQVRAHVDAWFDAVDIVVTAAATCEAPPPEDTGDPIMSTIWTDAGTPAVSVPVLCGPRGLPLGLQVIARRGRDVDALAFAATLEDARSRA